MKLLKKNGFLPLILLISLLGSCDDDALDIVVPDAEETGVFLEQDLHLLYLSREDDRIEEQINSVNEDLQGDPDNKDLMAQLQELEEQRDSNADQINYITNQITTVSGNLAVRPRVPRLPPVPPPPLPCNCLDQIDFTRVQEILIVGNTENFAVTVFSDNQEVLGEFGNLSDFENTDLSVLSIESRIDFEGSVTIQITKFFEPVNDVITYSLQGDMNL